MGDVLAECLHELRSSKFEFEVLLGASVGSVWQALGRHVARQLTQHKGVSLQQFGKFGFYKAQTSTLSAEPVFLLADRYTSAYGIVWRNRQPPAPLTVTSEVNMAALGNEASLGHDQTRRALDAMLVYLGKKLQGNAGAGNLALPGVGSFFLDGRALSFSFDQSLIRALANRGQQEAAPSSPVFKKTGPGGMVDNWKRKTLLLDAATTHANGESAALQRSTSVDSVFQSKAKTVQLKALAHFEPPHLGDRYGDGGGDANISNKEKIKKHRHRHRRHKHGHGGNRNSIETLPLNGVPILPRFLIPETREVLKPRPKVAQVMQEAFERETASIELMKRLDVEHDEMIATRQRVVQIRDLQERAEQAVSRRELNAFLNNQIEEKRRARHKAATDKDQCSYRDIKILPLGREVSDDVRRAEKQKLNQRLNDQVAAKVALKKDRRALDQAESAYFISKLVLQAESEKTASAERKRVEKEALLAEWSQQRAISAQKKHIR